MFVNTFIKRPVLTTVCTFIILLLGSICIPILPISQLPDLAPVQITVSSTNIGADAQTTESTVTNIIERQINGVKDVSYISSNTGNDGSSNITVSFPTDVNSDIAQVNVQNKETLASPQLPDAVQRTGVTVQTASSSLLLVYGFYSENNEYDNLFISNYVDLYILDEIKRLPGVGQATIFGERKYAMRLWLDPNKLAQHQLTPQDVTTALQEQNIQVGAGTIGQEPAPDNQSFEFALRATSRFKNAAEFEDMVLKVTQGAPAPLIAPSLKSEMLVELNWEQRAILLMPNSQSQEVLPRQPWVWGYINFPVVMLWTLPMLLKTRSEH